MLATHRQEPRFCLSTRCLCARRPTHCVARRLPSRKMCSLKAIPMVHGWDSRTNLPVEISNLTVPRTNQRGLSRSVRESTDRRWKGLKRSQRITSTILSLDFAPLTMMILDFGTLKCFVRISSSLLLARPPTALSSTLTSKLVSPVLVTCASFAFEVTRTSISMF